MAVKNATAKLSPPIILKQEIMTEEIIEETKVELPKTIDTKRYVHENPREFKGRLGYACLNTVLRAQKPSVFCSRTCRLSKAVDSGVGLLQELSFQNIADLKKLVQWNEDNNIKFMRISSNVFPFGTHEKAGYSIDFAKDALADVGALANKYNHRLTMHPGQFNQLVSLTPKVVVNTVRELEHHAHMLDLMGLDQDAIMIIHMGGVYGDRESAIGRFEKEYMKLPDNVKRRLVLENDELGYSVSDLLPVCQKLGVPLVLDWHHHYINPGNITDLVSLLPAINKIWTDKGIKPKQHYSESRRGARTLMELRAHSDRVKNLPPTTNDVDLMIEAKDKEQAVLELYKLYDLNSVNEEFMYLSQASKRLRQRVERAKKEEEEETEEEDIEDKELKPVLPMRQSKRNTVAKNYKEIVDENESATEEIEEKPVKKSKAVELVKKEENEKPKKRTRTKIIEETSKEFSKKRSTIKIEGSDITTEEIAEKPEKKKRTKKIKVVESELVIGDITKEPEKEAKIEESDPIAGKLVEEPEHKTELVESDSIMEEAPEMPKKKTREKRAKAVKSDPTVEESAEETEKKTTRKRSKKA
ncbi:unnamed protein product [Rhizopus stolonifer]